MQNWTHTSRPKLRKLDYTTGWKLDLYILALILFIFITQGLCNICISVINLVYFGVPLKQSISLGLLISSQNVIDVKHSIVPVFMNILVLSAVNPCH